MKRIPRSLLVVSLLVASLLANRCLLADELPEDLGNVHSLSLQKAKTLVAEFKLHGSLPDGANGLFLRGLETLSVETAKTLSEFGGPFIELNGVTTLSADAAAELARFRGKWLSMNGMDRISADAAG
jgi:hypothetical protein